MLSTFVAEDLMTGGFIGLIFLLFIYWLPSIVAMSRKHQNGGAIFILNLFLGWTLIGWVIALVWSCTGTGVAEPSPTSFTSPKPSEPPRIACETCGEFIMETAKICRFCNTPVQQRAKPEAHPSWNRSAIPPMPTIATPSPGMKTWGKNGSGV